MLLVARADPRRERPPEVTLGLRAKPGWRFAVNMVFYVLAFVLFVLGTVIVFTFDPAKCPDDDMTTTHTYDAVIVGAGGAGLRAAIEARPRPHRGDLQALPDALAHRRGAGRDVRAPSERRGGLPRSGTRSTR
jgi:hypothetical protein